MDLKINGIGFGGKREVLYSLKKAATEARQAELYRASSFGPRPVNRNSECEACKKAVDAYLDSAVYDNSFTKTLKDIPEQEFGQTLKSILEPKQLVWGKINPTALFLNSLYTNCMEQGKNIDIAIFNNFFNFIHKK